MSGLPNNNINARWSFALRHCFHFQDDNYVLIMLFLAPIISDE